ncbi:MAG: hypothetical protein HY059_22710 [Proteobacteria bacterium]|nr:hypothetical protein [Pseudomonadota bacterium]
MKRSIIAALIAVTLAPGLAGAEKKESPARSPEEKVNMKVSAKARLGSVERSGTFVTLSGTQTNNVLNEDEAKVSKKDQGSVGFIVNFVARVVEKGKSANIQLQVELRAPMTDGTHKMLQYQGEVFAELGRPITLLQSPERNLEITIEELPGR